MGGHGNIGVTQVCFLVSRLFRSSSYLSSVIYLVKMTLEKLMSSSIARAVHRTKAMSNILQEIADEFGNTESFRIFFA